jgi:hypothetical protein
MASDAGKSSQTTTYAPSLVDEQKARTLNMLRGLLFPALTPEVAGAMTSRTQEGMDSTNKKGLSSSAGSGLQKGDVGMLSNMAAGKGNNNSALNMALQLYGYGGTGSPSSNTTSKASAAQTAGAYGALGGSGMNALKEGYQAYNKYTQAYQDNMASSVNSGPGYTQDPNFTGFKDGVAQFNPEAFSLSPEAMGAIDAGVGSAAGIEGFGLGGAIDAGSVGLSGGDILAMVMENPELLAMA